MRILSSLTLLMWSLTFGSQWAFSEENSKQEPNSQTVQQGEAQPNHPSHMPNIPKSDVKPIVENKTTEKEKDSDKEKKKQPGCRGGMLTMGVGC